jgi:hypothetical protein
MTPEDLLQKLTEWEKLCDAATPAPWKLDSMGMFVFGPNMEMVVSERDESVAIRGTGAQLPMEANAAFIAAARTALPEAIKEIRQLQERQAVLENALTESVKLQSHYAKLLNMHDGGERIGFKNAEEWIARLQVLAKRE